MESPVSSSKQVATQHQGFESPVPEFRLLDSCGLCSGFQVTGGVVDTMFPGILVQGSRCPSVTVTLLSVHSDQRVRSCFYLAWEPAETSLCLCTSLVVPTVLLS